MNVSEAINLLKKQGYKYTEKREMILTFLEEEKRYIPAKDVLEHMKKTFPQISFDTIYRNLSVFVQLNILEETELDGEKRFRLNCSKVEHHHHLICLECGKTKQIEHCPMEMIHSQFADFQISGHKFEVYGTCQNCLT